VVTEIRDLDVDRSACVAACNAAGYCCVNNNGGCRSLSCAAGCLLAWYADSQQACEAQCEVGNAAGCSFLHQPSGEVFNNCFGHDTCGCPTEGQEGFVAGKVWGISNDCSSTACAAGCALAVTHNTSSGADPCTASPSGEEMAFKMWGNTTCQEMQDGWQVCTRESDTNHQIVMANCPITCAKARGSPCVADLIPDGFVLQSADGVCSHSEDSWLMLDHPEGRAWTWRDCWATCSENFGENLVAIEKYQSRCYCISACDTLEICGVGFITNMMTRSAFELPGCSLGDIWDECYSDEQCDESLRCNDVGLCSPLCTQDEDCAKVKGAERGYSSSTGYLHVVFTSDYTVTRSGFVAYWNVSSPVGANVSCSCNEAMPATCAQMSSLNSSGTITLSDYANNARCEWLITADSSESVINLTFVSFDTEVNFDFVTINQCQSPSCVDPEQIARLSGGSQAIWVCNQETSLCESDMGTSEPDYDEGISGVVLRGRFNYSADVDVACADLSAHKAHITCCDDDGVCHRFPPGSSSASCYSDSLSGGVAVPNLHGVSFETAVVTCSLQGMRLCTTQAELQPCDNTGCGHDSNQIWTAPLGACGIHGVCVHACTCACVKHALGICIMCVFPDKPSRSPRVRQDVRKNGYMFPSSPPPSLCLPPSSLSLSIITPAHF